MHLLRYLIFPLVMMSCHREEAPQNAITLSQPYGDELCIKCNTRTSEYVLHHWEHLTKAELQRFLCTFEYTCTLGADWMEEGTREYQEIRLMMDMLFFLFNTYFEDYLELLEAMNFLDQELFIDIFSEPAGCDLPHDRIIKKLKELEQPTTYQLRLIKAFKTAINARNAQLLLIKH